MRPVCRLLRLRQGRQGRAQARRRHAAGREEARCCRRRSGRGIVLPQDARPAGRREEAAHGLTFFFPLGGEKGRESNNGRRGGSLSIFFPSLSRKVFPNLSRTRQKKGCRRPPPSSALRGPCRPPCPLRVGRRPFLSRGRTCSASPSGRSRRVRRRRAAATGRHAGEEETLARMSPRAASEMSLRNPPSLRAYA